jgi:hypothetical protein
MALIGHAGVMPVEIPLVCRQLIDDQDGALATAQALDLGMPAEGLRSQVRCGRWQQVHRGVYAAFNGTPTRQSQLWAALLRAGPDAVLSHQSAAELYGLLDDHWPVIHVTVPHVSNPARRGAIFGVVVHRSRLIARRRHPVLTPPRTRVDETVLDLIECSKTFDEAYGWICRAIGSRLTTAARLRAKLDDRSRFRWRRDIELALGHAENGVLSLLELRYVRGVEQPHGLPTAKRQALIRDHTGSRYLDNLYEEYQVCVELDGTAAHPAHEQWRDKRRDRKNLIEEGIVTVRVGFVDLRDAGKQCETAAELAALLSARGPKVGHPCAAGCPV